MVLSCPFLFIFDPHCFGKRENLTINYLWVQLTSTWKWHLVFAEDLMSLVCAPDLKKEDKWEEILLWLMSQSSYSCQVYELSTFSQDLGDQADINSEVITVSIICRYLKWTHCTIYVPLVRNILLYFPCMGMFLDFRNWSLCRNTQSTPKRNKTLWLI